MVVMELHITVRGREGGWYKPDNGEAADIGLNIGCGGSLYCAQQRGTAQNTN